MLGISYLFISSSLTASRIDKVILVTSAAFKKCFLHSVQAEGECFLKLHKHVRRSQGLLDLELIYS